MKIKITNIRNKTKDITIDPTDIKRTIRKYYEQLYDNTFSTLDKLEKFLTRNKVQNLIQEEIDNLNGPIATK